MSECIILNKKQSKGLKDAKKWFNSDDKYKKPFIISGYAGTGKSLMASMIARELNFDPNGNEVRFVAYTGMAAGVLTKKGVNACTIHRLIYNPKVELSENKNGKKTENIDFILKDSNSLEGIKLIIVDEISMVSETIFNDLLSFCIPIIVIGDDFQLQPPSSDKSMGYLLEKPDVLLDEPMRNDEDSGILYVANAIRTGESLDYGSYGEVEIIPREDLTDEICYEVDQILTAKNVTVNNINTFYRYNILNKRTRFPENKEKLICLKNNWSLEIYENGIYQNLVNGLIGQVDNINNLNSKSRYDRIDFKPLFLDKASFNGITMDELYFSDNIKNDNELYNNYEKYKSILYNRKNILKNMGIKINKFTYGYCITVYKAQGSEFNKVLYIDEMMNRKTYYNHLYTAITRAKEKLYLVI